MSLSYQTNVSAKMEELAINDGRVFRYTRRFSLAPSTTKNFLFVLDPTKFSVFRGRGLRCFGSEVTVEIFGGTVTSSDGTDSNQYKFNLNGLSSRVSLANAFEDPVIVSDGIEADGDFLWGTTQGAESVGSDSIQPFYRILNPAIKYMYRLQNINAVETATLRLELIWEEIDL